MYTQNLRKLNIMQPTPLSVSISNLAYMDNTALIASNQEAMISLYQITKSFYKATDIKDNLKKYQLIILNSKNKTITLQNNQIVKAAGMNESVKYLGILINGNGTYKDQKRNIFEFMENAANIMRKKKITDIQIIYIYNRVLLPAVKYKWQTVTMTETECRKLLTTLIKIIKQKSYLAKTLPTTTLTNPHLYDVKDIWGLQAQHHIPNLIYRLNNKGILGVTTKIRLTDLQQEMWENKCILQTIPIEGKSSMKANNIIYNIMLVTIDGKHLLRWDHWLARNKTQSTRKKPSWYGKIEQVVMENPITRVLHERYIINDPNLTYQSNSNNKNSLIIAKHKDIITYGKYHSNSNNSNKNQINNGEINLIHYQTSCQISPTTSPTMADWESPHMLKCTGCKGNSNNNQECIIRIKSKESIKIPYSKGRDGDLKLRITTGELGKINPISNNSQTYDNNNNTINGSEEHGSVKKIGHSECKMGIGWIVTSGPAKGSTFKANINKWPAQFKAELLAIFTAALTVPKEKIITIYTDNQSLEINFNKVKAHTGIKHNEVADQLASEGSNIIKTIHQKVSRNQKHNKMVQPNKIQ
ncbi:729_t:CDS:2 [Entrophospora sp. SA101]|nr:729_t:CDS:2 [Entrophospora sp. SA101]